MKLEKLSTALLADWAENETLYFQIQHITHLLPKLTRIYILWIGKINILILSLKGVKCTTGIIML